MPAKKTSEKQHYPSGEIVFAKLKGYPWWPAKVEDESNVPKAVLEAKRKKKATTGTYIVFFFGSLDYAFFSEKMLRPFDRETVQQDIKAAKFKNKDLVEALYQALDPTGLDFSQGSTQQQDRDYDSGTTQQQNTKHTKSNTTSRSRSSTKRKTTATTQRVAPIYTKKRTQESEDHSKTYHGNDRSTKRRKSSPTDKPIPATTESPKSKYIEKAAKSSPEYERIFKRIYGHRYKLQKLIYDKKPGQVPASDHSKINDILKDVQQCNMTKELLKDTKIGKVVQFGCDYVFENDDSYRLQERCVEIMKNWKASLLDRRGTPTALNTTSATLASPQKNTTICNEPPSAIFDNNSRCNANNKNNILATPTSPKAGKITPLTSATHIKDHDCATTKNSTLENNKPHTTTQNKLNNNNNTDAKTKIELAISNYSLGDVPGNLDPSSTASPTTMTDNLIPLPQAFNMGRKDSRHHPRFYHVPSQDC